MAKFSHFNIVVAKFFAHFCHEKIKTFENVNKTNENFTKFNIGSCEGGARKPQALNRRTHTHTHTKPRPVHMHAFLCLYVSANVCGKFSHTDAPICLAHPQIYIHRAYNDRQQCAQIFYQLIHTYMCIYVCDHTHIQPKYHILYFRIFKQRKIISLHEFNFTNYRCECARIVAWYRLLLEGQTITKRKA